MEINNHLPDATRTTVPTSNCNHETWDCSGEQNTTVTLRKQQQRAQSSLTFGTVGSKPITSTHIWTCAPGQTHSSRRAGEERREGIWFSHMMVVRISLPTTHSSPTSPSQRASPNTSTLILSYPFLSFFIVLERRRRKKKLVSFALHWRMICRLPYVVWIPPVFPYYCI